MKTSHYLLLVFLASLAVSMSFCVVREGRHGAAISSIEFYDTLPASYDGPYYYHGNRYYYGGRWETGRFLDNGGYHDGRYFHNGHYITEAVSI